jgi:sigma-E factor negative regulatory protein RseC
MKKSKDYIEHEGIVTDLTESTLKVEIVSKSACSSCHAKGACSMGDMKVKYVEVDDPDAILYEKGERVNVVLRKSLGYKALIYSYIIPLVIMMVLLIILSEMGYPDLTIGLGVLGSLAAYYLLLWVFKDKFKKDFVFAIEKLDK